MKKINFNDEWLYSKLDGADIKKINLPHDAMIYENRSKDSLGGKHISWFIANDYKYEKEFIPSLDDKDKHFIIEFEGVYKDSKIYLNDQFIYERPYGYTNFYVDLTKDLIYGKKNKLRVEVNNSDQPNSRWYTGAGIYRPVNLFILPKDHIYLNGVKIHTIDYEKREVNLSVKSNGSGHLILNFYYKEKLVLSKKFETNGDFDQNLILDGFKLWDDNNPCVYTLEAIFNNNKPYITTFGIRSVKVNAQNGLTINGNRKILRGACIHHDNGLLGAVSHPFAEYRKVKLLKEAGYNSIRSAHNPASKALLDACDELGIFVLDEYVDMWYIHKNIYDYAKDMKKWWKEDLKDMVDKDFNHPSVIMYSIGNEVAETSEEKGINLASEMTNYLKKLDNRPVTCGINIFFNYLYSLGFGVYTDKKAKKNLKKSQKSKAVGSEFFNNLAGLLGDKTMKMGAALRGSDRKTRQAFSKLDVAGYNYGIYRYKKDLKKYPDRVILGTETFCVDAYKFYELAKENNALIGDFVWSGMDYLGEVGIGSWIYKDRTKDFTHGVGWMTAGSGRIDINGGMSSEVSYTRVAYELDDIRIGVIPVNNYGTKHSPSAWKMSNAIESWSWDNLNNKKTIVEVYTRAHRVKLYINGRLVGNKKRKNNAILKFKVRYQRGNVVAVGLDSNNKVLYYAELKSALDETVLTLTPEQQVISINDLCYVNLEFTDQNGEVKVLERHTIEVEVKNGELIGLGHSCPYSEHGYKTFKTDTYFGKALAIIKPLKLGNIEISAKSKIGNSSTIVKVK